MTTIEERIAAAEQVAARKARESAAEIEGWRLAERLGVEPRYVHVSSYPPNTPLHFAFELAEPEDVKDWRQRVADLMRLLPPVPLFRFKASCLSYTPELSPKQAADERAQVAQVVPWTVKLESYGGHAAPTAEVTWYTGSDPRVHVTVRVGNSIRGGSYAAGLRYDCVYSNRSTREILRATPVFPFRVNRSDTFWSDGLMKPTVAWWDLSCLPVEACASTAEGAPPYTLVDASAAWLALTEPG